VLLTDSLFTIFIIDQQIFFLILGLSSAQYNDDEDVYESIYEVICPILDSNDNDIVSRDSKIKVI